MKNAAVLSFLAKQVKFFRETTELLSERFSDNSSLFKTHWECLDLVKEKEDLTQVCRK